MDQTPGGTTPPTTDTPATPQADNGMTGVTSSDTPAGPPPVSETPATPSADQAPSGPPALDITPTTESPAPAGNPSEAPDASEAEKPGETPSVEPATHTDTPATDSITAAAPAHTGDASSAHSEAAAKTDAPSTPPAHGEDHKSFSKPMMVVAGLLVVGALSAVLLVANMQPGDTQSSANSPRQRPALPTQAAAPAQQAMMTDPNLMITTPKEGSTVTSSTVIVTGKTFPNAEVVVNESEVTANPGGVFTASATLEEGENTIIIVANDAEGNAAETEVNVSYEME